MIRGRKSDFDSRLLAVKFSILPIIGYLLPAGSSSSGLLLGRL
jgi:hypothetical protein